MYIKSHVVNFAFVCDIAGYQDPTLLTALAVHRPVAWWWESGVALVGNRSQRVTGLPQ